MAQSLDDLRLDLRDGLSDDIAYLRAAYPKGDWRAHANFGDMAGFWLHVHDSLRHHGAQLDRLTRSFQTGPGQAGDFQRAFVPGINQFLSHLNGHHQIEDSAYFPKFRALDPRMEAGFGLLEADHALIHEQLLASVDTARAMVQALGSGGDPRQATDAYAAASARLLDLLMRHLADEEDLVIPAILRHGERSIL
jgi:iron-sulfur cluster repair protein YtfE (RIC family)